MPKKNNQSFSQMYLADALNGEVEAWANQGWHGVTQITLELFNYWFKRDEDTTERFHPCQQRAIETLVYCHEILQAKTLQEVFERVAPEAISQHLPLKQEIDTIPFPKYALKMATGSGKTWVLAALLVWQYFNKLNDDRPGNYSSRFLVVTPGHEVLNRLLDSFKGKRDLKSGNRMPETSDYKRSLFIPEGSHWRDRFHLDVLEPSDVKPNTTPPDGPFVYITNWQQFRLKSSATNLWDKFTGADVEDMPRGEIIADFLSEYPDLVIMNDEAHHVHGKKSGTGDELVWRQFMNVLHGRLTENHKAERGVFLQIDFSATPFYGSAEKREYFPHIIYDYDLLNAMQDMLNNSADILAFAKLDKKHKLKVSYRDETGILRNYEIDFIVKTPDKIYLVETKADKDIDSPNTAVKVQAAKAWCEQASLVQPPEEINQSQEWEYLILSEGLYKSNKGLSFEAFVPLCRGLGDNIVAKAKSLLFLL